MVMLSVRVALIAAILSVVLHAEVSQWTNVGPESGSVGWLAVDPQNPANEYALTCAGGLFKTGNGGASWSPMAGFPAIGCNPNSLVADPINAGTLYAITCSEIFKSAD